MRIGGVGTSLAAGSAHGSEGTGLPVALISPQCGESRLLRTASHRFSFAMPIKRLVRKELQGPETLTARDVTAFAIQFVTTITFPCGRAAGGSSYLLITYAQ
jgi:hypothetical protein